MEALEQGDLVAGRLWVGIAGVGDPIAVAVGRCIVRDRRARVAGVTEPVAVLVALIGVGDARAIVHGVGDAVAVAVVRATPRRVGIRRARIRAPSADLAHLAVAGLPRRTG